MVEVVKIVGPGEVGRMNKKKRLHCDGACRRTCGVFSLVFSACFAGLSAIIVWKTGIVDHLITKSLTLVNQTQVFEMWVQPPVDPVYKIHLFNYTNIEEVKAGREKRFKVQELGPYVYNQKREKVEVRFYENDTVGFQYRFDYKFDLEKSRGTEEDHVVVPNLSLLGAVFKMHNENLLKQVGLAAVIGGLSSSPFMDLTVGDYLWGYDDWLFDMGKNVYYVPFERMALLAGLNGTQRHRLSVHTGVNDLSQLGVISSFDGMSELDVWYGEECNRLDGSEGSMFPPPLVARGERLSIYNAEMCRKLPLEFQHTISLFGLPAMRYALPDDVFVTNNTCFCDPEGTCPPDGVFDVSKCAFGGPVMISFPHFYRGDPSLHELIEGLSPSKENHSFFLDMHERFGVILGGKSRMQLNILAKHARKFPCMNMFKKDIILPIAWFEVTVDNLPESVKSDLRLATHTASHGLLYVLLTAFLVSCAALAYFAARRPRLRATRAPSIHHKDATALITIAVSNAPPLA